MGVRGQRRISAALPPGKRHSAHFTGGWTGAENLALTAHPVASRYTDEAIPA